MQVKVVNDLTEYNNFSLTSIVIGELSNQYIILNVNWEEWEDTTKVYITLINKSEVDLIDADIDDTFIKRNLLLLNSQY